MEKSSKTLTLPPSKPINTHNLLVTFGKHKGERWTRIPLSYLRWLVNERTQYSDIAAAELERRGSNLLTNKSVELSGHAIDKASLRLRKRWHETKVDENEGLFTWLERMSEEALEVAYSPEQQNIIYKSIKFVFMRGAIYPVLKTVMPAPTVEYVPIKLSDKNLVEIRHKGVYMQLSINDDSMSIYLVESNNQKPGEVQELIDIIRGDFPGKKLTSSAPLSPTMKHILDKKEVITTE